jgi:predicted metal-dependent phosphoesterase TrpH
MLARLRDLGFEIDQDEVEAEAKGESTGRPHLARVLVRNGIVSSFDEAFEKYLAQGQPAYAERPRPTLAEGIQAILNAQGVPVIAHPLTVEVSPRQLIETLVPFKLQGIEYYYPYHQMTGQPPEWYSTIDSNLALLQDLAREYDLILTGGTDYHGAVPGKADLGSIPVPARVLDQLRQRYKALFGVLPSPLKAA